MGVILGGAGLIFAAAVAGVLISKNHKAKDAKTEENKQEDDQHNTVATNRGAQNNATRIVYFKKTPNGDEIKNLKYKYFRAPNGSKVLLPLPQTLSATVTNLGFIMRLRKNEIVQELQKLCSEAASCSESEHFVGESDIPQGILDRDVIDEDEEIKTIDRYPDIFYERYNELLSTMMRKEKEQEGINDLVSQIKKICSFNGGVASSYDDQMKIVLFKSQFDSYLQNGELDIESLKAALQNGTLDKNQLKRDIEPLSSIVNREPEKEPILFVPISTSSGDSLTTSAQQLKDASEKDMIRDMEEHYEQHTKKLINSRDSFRELINHAKCQVGDINLSFQKSFFEQEFSAPYRNLNMDTIYSEWNLRGEKVESYRPNCELEKKLVEILNRWFPDVKAFSDIKGGTNERQINEISTYIEDTKGMKKTSEEQQEESDTQFNRDAIIEREVPVIRYMFCYHGHRFDRLIHGQGDKVSPKLFVQMLYMFEKEAERLGVEPEDLNNIGTKPKEMNFEQAKLRDLWSAFKTALMSMSVGCSRQLSKMINTVAEKFDAYQSAQASTDTRAETLYSLFDRKFCQLLREKATNSAVASCPVVTNEGGGSLDYASKIKSIYVPLVNVIDSGYQRPLRKLDSYGETYQTLAEKWKNAISSYGAIKETLVTICRGMGSEEQFNEFKELPMSFDEFVYIVKSINVKSIGNRDCKTWKDEISGLYKKFKSRCEADKDGYVDKEKSSLDTMGKWVDGKGNITLNDLITLITVTFFDVEGLENSGIYQLLQDADDIRTIAYIIHLARSGMIIING